MIRESILIHYGLDHVIHSFRKGYFYNLKFDIISLYI